MKDSRGFTLISAIFLMVVLAVLSVSLVTVSSVQHATAAQQLQTVRASYAVRSGVAWAAKRAEGGICAAASFTLVDDFTVSVTCARTDHDLGAGAPQAYYLLNVTAQAGSYGSVDFVTRRAQAKVLGP